MTPKKVKIVMTEHRKQSYLKSNLATAPSASDGWGGYISHIRESKSFLPFASETSEERKKERLTLKAFLHPAVAERTFSTVVHLRK